MNYNIDEPEAGESTSGTWAYSFQDVDFQGISSLGEPVP